MSTEEQLSRMRSIRTVAHDSAKEVRRSYTCYDTDGPCLSCSCFLSYDTEHLLTNHRINLLFYHLYPTGEILSVLFTDLSPSHREWCLAPCRPSGTFVRFRDEDVRG